MKIRTTQHDDLSDLSVILNQTQLFPTEMLSELIAPFLSGNSEEIWLSCNVNDRVAGFCYARPEEMTVGTWNLLAIAVQPALQGKGIGSALVRELESMLRQRKHRILIVDTSSTVAFAETRLFYRSNGFTQEAQVRDFWAQGDDKVIFWKSLREN